MTRMAISPRLAMRILRNDGAVAVAVVAAREDEKCLQLSLPKLLLLKKNRFAVDADCNCNGDGTPTAKLLLATAALILILVDRAFRCIQAMEVSDSLLEDIIDFV